jgi:hypothetical protein
MSLLSTGGRRGSEESRRFNSLRVPPAYTPVGYASVIVGQKRRITPRLTRDQAERRFQALFCSRTGEMSGAPLALPGLWPFLTHDLGLRPPRFDPW